MSDAQRIALRLGGVLALVLAAVAIGTLLFRGGDSYEVTAEFENASQLVRGNLVQIGGVPAGDVSEIDLAPNGHALVSFTVEEPYAPLPEGTRATIRSISLATIADRRVQLDLPAEGEDGGGAAEGRGEIPDGGRIPLADTVSAVDLDQLLNSLDRPAVADLKRVIRGLETASDGVGEEANRGLRYLNPLLSTSRRVLGELGRDRGRLESLLVDTSQLSGALAERAPEISALVRNLNVSTSAIGRQRAALAAAIRKLPAFLRESNTTLVNLRAAIGDVEPLVVATDPVAERLQPFFRELRAAARDGVPTIRDLDAIVRRRGGGNDLVELVRAIPPLARTAIGRGRPDCGEDPSEDFEQAADDDFRQGALGEASCVARNSVPIVRHLRPYAPELVGWFDDFSTSGAIDANGGIARIAGTFNAFSASPSTGLPELLAPIDPAELFGGDVLDIGNEARCPGANERNAADGSVPFTDGGRLNCDPTQVATGP